MLDHTYSFTTTYYTYEDKVFFRKTTTVETEALNQPSDEDILQHQAYIESYDIVSDDDPPTVSEPYMTAPKTIRIDFYNPEDDGQVSGYVLIQTH